MPGEQPPGSDGRQTGAARSSRPEIARSAAPAPSEGSYKLIEAWMASLRNARASGPAASPPPLSPRRLSNLRLVCKRWKGIFDGSLRLLTYGCFHVWPEHLLGKGTGASPAPAVLDTAALVRLAACLAAVVQEACIEEAHKPGRLEAVEQLPHLVSLMLTAHSDYCNEQPGLVLAQRQLGLGALPQLRQLSLHVSGLLGPTCQQLAAARHLTSLEAGDLLYQVGTRLPRQGLCLHSVAFLWSMVLCRRAYAARSRRMPAPYPPGFNFFAPHQVPDALWDAVACLPNLVVLEVHVHAAPEGTIIPSLAWQRLAACTRLACLRLLNCYVSGGADEYGECQSCRPARVCAHCSSHRAGLLRARRCVRRSCTPAGVVDVQAAPAAGQVEESLQLPLPLCRLLCAAVRHHAAHGAAQLCGPGLHCQPG